ncbi:helix-turn-helix domain-containing protein [Mesorhizobium yinganensis]|uniref:helix-turn-helix domain-containing protein n=1 Tax=Mesorhizobium yinganensis TaxID=3157707 RepID=UPI0032B78065
MQTQTAFRKDEAKPPARVKPGLPASGRRGERVMEVCEAMIDVCAALYGVSSKEIRQTCKSAPEIIRVRQIAMYVTHTALGVSMQEVGRGFARDRTTVRYACHVIEDLRDDDDFDRTVAMTERVALAAFRNRLEY